MGRQELISRTFIALADTLVANYDPIDFLQQLADRCVDILDVADAGIVLMAPGGLHVMASSSERMHVIELLEVQRRDGPCLEAWETGGPVEAHRLADTLERWPTFAPAALAAGYRSVYALPMRLRAEAIGALNLFADHPSGLDQPHRELGQALADMATIGILHERMHHDHQILTDQLQTALTSRITLEQAKGVIAEQAGVDMQAAFEILRGYARNTNTRLTQVARDVIDRRLSTDQLRDPTTPKGHRARRR